MLGTEPACRQAHTSGGTVRSVLSAMALAVYSIAPTIRAFALAALEKVSKGLATNRWYGGRGQVSTMTAIADS